MILRDNSMSINTHTTPKSLVQHNQPSSDIRTSFKKCKKRLKFIIIGMGEYTVEYSIATLPVSPLSYGKLTEIMKPKLLTMTIFGTFVQSSIP